MLVATITSEDSAATFLSGAVGGNFECLTDAATIVVNNNKESRVSGPYANYSTHTERATGQPRERRSRALVFIPGKISVFVSAAKNSAGAAGLRSAQTQAR